MQETLLKLFSLGSIGILIFCFLFILLEIFKIKNPVKTCILKAQTELIFFVSLFATVGSILLSIYFQLAPCELCWYQRMFLFPIPIIAFIATVRKDLNSRIYMLTFSVIGLIIALYHSFLQLNVFKTVSAFCNPNSPIDCSVPAFVYFGFVTVPVISFSVFLLLVITTYAYTKKN
jgi:disulfide bond formation protein DsbB